MAGPGKRVHGPLAGVRVVELAGIGPGPFAAMLLADLGADVVRVDRPGGGGLAINPEYDVTNRNKRSVILDLKTADGVARVLDLVERADVLVEGYRPGVAERLGVGPGPCHARNPALVYARMTGWGQDGPLARRAGHDIAYIAITGALGMIGNPGEPPVVPANLVGDYAGGALYLVVGALAALHHARVHGEGQVVDAAIVDGAAHLSAMIHGMLAAGSWQDRRGANLLDGGCPFYGAYETSDGGHMAVGPLEQRFYDEFAALLGLGEAADARNDPGRWGELRAAVAAHFKERTREEWTALFGDSDACVAPVLSLREAPAHPHLAARGTFTDHGGITQPAPAPRFSRTPTEVRRGPARPGAHTAEVAGDWGVPGLAPSTPPPPPEDQETTYPMKRQIFSAEHDAFRETVRTFLAKEVLPHYEQWEKDGIVSRDAWLAAGRQGLLGLAVPEEYGGGGNADFRYSAVLAEEFTRAGAAGLAVGLHNDIIGPYLTSLTTGEQKRRWLPGFCSGELITAIAMTEPGAGSDLQAVRTSAEDRGDHWVLNGSKTFISNGILADLVIVVAKTSPQGGAHGLSLLVVERGMEGFERGRNLDKIGQKSQDTAELFFHDVRVPKENLLGDLNGAFVHLMTNLAQERMGIAVAGIAAAEHLLEITTEYVKEREAFGRPLAKLQHIRFEIAEMATECAVTRTFLDRCVVDHSNGELDAVHASMAKWWATELQKRVADRCLQLHGGYGYMAEHRVARAFTDGRIQTIYGGTTEIMKEIIGRSLLG